MKKNSIPKEFQQYIDEDLLNITWEEEGEKVKIFYFYYLNINIDYRK